MIMHHISDDYSWHFFDIGGFHATLYLPVMVYKEGEGLIIFSSSRFSHGNHEYKGLIYDHGELKAADESVIYDFSITKNVFAMLVSAILLIIILMQVAKTYKKREGMAPKGFQNFLEVIIIFLRDELAKPIIGESKYERFFPFLLTVFFFIWLNNLMGLLPGAANVTGNIAVTAALALITFIITQVSGNKHYYQHIFWPPAPFLVKFILIPVEILGMFTKPIALAIRLLANITAGHILIMSVLSLMFLFGASSAFGGFGVSILAVPFATFLYFLELLVALIQAYVFTLLSAVFIGMAVEEHH